MRGVTRGIAVGVVVTGLLLGCRGPDPRPPEPQTPQSSWAHNMRSLSTTVMDILPYLFDEQAYESPQNASAIRKGLGELAETAHHISPSAQLPVSKNDPGLHFSLEDMRENIARSIGAFDGGQKAYSRQMAKAVLNKCFHCHTRNQLGPQLEQPISNTPKLKLLRPLERLDLYVALRNYDKALSEARELISRPIQGENRGFEVDGAIQKGLTIAVRVKRDPQMGMQLVDLALKNPTLPFYLRQNGLSWRQGLLAWSQSRKVTNADPLLQARRLLDSQGHSPYSSLRIEHLIASTLLHDYLQTPRGKNETAEAFYLLGRSYEGLKDFGSQFLGETHFEACIELAPKTRWSERCYRGLEEGVYSAHATSSGIFVPKTLLEKLDRLRLRALGPKWHTEGFDPTRSGN